MFSSSCTSAVANDAVRHVSAARTLVWQRGRDREVGHHPRLEVIGPHVLLDLQLDVVAAWPEVRPFEGALELEWPARQARGPVAVDVHIPGEQRSTIAPDGHHEHGFAEVLQ